MKYLSVCSGIEAATMAWHPLGWEPVAFSENEPFASAVLAEKYPHVPNLGDMTKYANWELPAFDLLVGGTPCQSFSLAGLRKGLADPRGNLALVYLGILDRFRPRWVVWENVPGVLSSNGGRDFGSFLGALGELGYGWAYRVLDSQYVRVDSHPRAVPQRRRRVFVVGHSGADWHSAAQVLFEPERVHGDSPPRRRRRGSVEPGVRSGVEVEPEKVGRSVWPAVVSPTLDRGSASICNQEANYGYGHFVPEVCGTLSRTGEGSTGQDATTGRVIALPLPEGTRVNVRRLTPREFERLQGFPDDFTLVPYRGKLATDGPRYHALGNSMAVNVMRFIGERIHRHDPPA